MKKILMAMLLSCLFVLILGSSALADTNLSDMTVSELSHLRDMINQEISSRTMNNGKIIIDKEEYVIEIISIEEGGKKEVNDYYDQFSPGTGTSNEYNRIIVLFIITNKTDNIMKMNSWLDAASINGWMVSGYVGVRELAPNKKAKGFINAGLIDCEADSLEEVNSFEFDLEIRDGDRKTIGIEHISLIRKDNGFILE